MAARSGRSFGSFQDVLNADIEWEKTIETVSRPDENIANNRLFVWNFEAVDLEEMADIFKLFQRDISNDATRQKLNDNLHRKMHAMLREGYNPVECMLYASKTINHRLSNDKSIQAILAERIRDIYLKKEDETADILNNIMDMWTWVPQLRVVIHAIGLIGDNEELLDKVSLNYGEDENLKDKAFYAFMQNKTMKNLERILKIIINLQNIESDQIMGRYFAKEVGGFGWDGIRLIEKYNENPAVSRTGKYVIRRIIRNNGNIVDDTGDGMYRETLANKSSADDMVFRDFMEDCRENRDRRAFFLCRFSKAEAGQFLKEVLESTEELDSASRNDAIVSLAMVGRKGYKPAAAVIQNCYREGEDNFGVVIAEVILGNRTAVKQLVDLLCEKRDHELFGMYGVLKTANLKFYTESLQEFHRILFSRFQMFVTERSYYALEILTSNLQILWDKKLFFLIPMELLKYMQSLLLEYAKGEVDLPEAAVISMMETLVYCWSDAVESVIFRLYKNSDNKRVQQLSFKILQNCEVMAPK